MDQRPLWGILATQPAMNRRPSSKRLQRPRRKQGCANSDFGRTKGDACLVIGRPQLKRVALGRTNTEVIPMKTLSEQPEISMNRSMPPSVIIPELAYADVPEAVEWLCRSFGFSERLRIGNHRAQLSFGEGSIIVTTQPTSQEPESSEAADSHPSAGGSNHAVMVRVADVDSHYERARQCGARIVHPPTDYPYGERQYTAEDLDGHRWTFSQTIVDVDPKAWGGILIE